MKKIILPLAIFLSFSLSGQVVSEKKITPDKGYAVTVQVTGARQGNQLYFNRYANSESYPVDSILVSVEGIATFKGEQLLEAGMYALSYGNVAVDFFITDGAPQHFSLTFDAVQGMMSLAATGSPENELFVDYVHFMGNMQQKAQALQTHMQQHMQNPDSAYTISQQMQVLDAQIKSKWNDLLTQQPESTLALFFQSIQDPKAPEEPVISPLETNRDSVMQAYYLNFYKTHFWDNIDFSDARILNMPFLKNILNIYCVRILPLDKQALEEGMDLLITKAKADRKVYEFIVRNRYDFFRTAPYPEIETVAAYIAEKYVVDDKEHWADKAYVTRMEDVVKMAKLNPVGAIATNLLLQTPEGTTIALHDIQASYTVLYFFNPGCSSCATVTPVLWETFQKYKEKNIQVFAVYVDRTQEEWLPYINKHQYHEWINVWDSEGTEGLYDKYDVHAIPTIYLLDDNKTVLYKDILIERLNEILTERLN